MLGGIASDLIAVIVGLVVWSTHGLNEAATYRRTLIALLDLLDVLGESSVIKTN